MAEYSGLRVDRARTGQHGDRIVSGRDLRIRTRVNAHRLSTADHGICAAIASTMAMAEIRPTYRVPAGRYRPEAGSTAAESMGSAMPKTSHRGTCTVSRVANVRTSSGANTVPLS
jgi:hypothetical protein